eukprot:GHVQ01025053.1.p1 GENE.GHVQ01025053.1~~GHVQ01025053.1.p1  ORF type:complete len:651 (+),score=39.48 GHVQ01025053.1:1039-2991(+)
MVPPNLICESRVADCGSGASATKSSLLTMLYFGRCSNEECPGTKASHECLSPDWLSRFVSFVRKWKRDELQRSCSPLVLFSGGAFAPEPFFGKGLDARDRVTLLNRLDIDCACFDKRDIELGVGELEFLSGASRFPWIMSNVCDKNSGAMLANASRYKLMPWGSLKLGLMCLGGVEWMSTLHKVSPESTEFHDAVETATTLCQILRNKGAQVILAVTHMSTTNVNILARQCIDIDFIIDGLCDFCTASTDPCATSPLVLPLMTDVSKISQVKIRLGEPDKCLLRQKDILGHWELKKPAGTLCGPTKCRVERKYVDTANATIPMDVFTEQLVSSVTASHRFQTVVSAKSPSDGGDSGAGCRIWGPLNISAKSLLTEECNSGNWLCDILTDYCNAEIALVNGGSVRGNTVYEKGTWLTELHVNQMLPERTGLVVIEASGEVILEALEHSVAALPAQDNRFLQVSGLRFCFNGCQPKGQRVLKDSVKIRAKKLGSSSSFCRRAKSPTARCVGTSHSLPGAQHTPGDSDFDYVELDMSRTYTIATTKWLYEESGYSMLRNCRCFVASSDILCLREVVQRVIRIAGMVNSYGEYQVRGITDFGNRRIQELPQGPSGRSVLGENECMVYELSPKLDGRISRVDTQLADIHMTAALR